MKKWLLFVCAMAAAFSATAAVLQREQQDLSQKLIRLHVVANSDSGEDQAVKLEVRDAILEVTENLDEISLYRALPEIRSAAEQRLRELECRDSVSVSLAKEQFPTRFYENFALPAGVYTALRITIGSGEGQNWWCVAFPSICFRATAAELEEAAVSAGFTTEEYRLITGDGEGYVLKFKLLELLDRLKQHLIS
jgi:stage II sporulation protein R